MKYEGYNKFAIDSLADTYAREGKKWNSIYHHLRFTYGNKLPKSVALSAARAATARRRRMFGRKLLKDFTPPTMGF